MPLPAEVIAIPGLPMLADLVDGVLMLREISLGAGI